MLAETRRRHLLDRIARQGFASLDELVKELAVSESTVRRDLEALELSGSIRRTHGGAMLADETRSILSFDERCTSATAEKRAIGRAAASLIDDGDTVLLDGGTTTLEVARALQGRPVQIVTNSLPIAQLAATNKETDLILLGGYVYPRTGVALGPLAIASMQGIRVRKAILGAGGIMAEGIFNANLLLVETEKQMMACGQETMIVADRSKFGRLSLAWLCGLDAVADLVVDAGVAEVHRQMLESAGVRVHLAAPIADAGDGEAAAPLIPARFPGPRSSS
ncbi:DeoR/GlpR family DNA-binding transcription regulator [Tundrisphaera sp. TA3]|uniref:DeoR/GlpR family DNA-binding transcription regulator n=1 Tax=Tundrisphaera sp. TA3 TaxID=3435775 RepID=UPI003EB9A54C